MENTEIILQTGSTKQFGKRQKHAQALILLKNRAELAEWLKLSACNWKGKHIPFPQQKHCCSVNWWHHCYFVNKKTVEIRPEQSRIRAVLTILTFAEFSLSKLHT